MPVIIAVATLVFVAVIVYWWRAPSRASVSACLVVALGVGLVVWFAWARQPQLTEALQAEPLVLAIAMDLSPSMLAGPAPSGGSTTPPRFERVLQVIGEVIEGLQASDGHFLISMTGFAGDAGVLIGWDDDLAAIREVLDVAVTPGLYGDDGTSLESAARSIADLFELLPSRFESARRVVLFASDGEETVRSGNVRYAAERLERSDATIIALQVGFTERNEGIRVYNDVGVFQGFRVLDGQRYSKPSPESMRELAGDRAGLFVRAEDPSASSQILEQLRSVQPTPPLDGQLLPLLGLFMITFLTLALVLK